MSLGGDRKESKINTAVGLKLAFREIHTETKIVQYFTHVRMAKHHQTNKQVTKSIDRVASTPD